MAADEIITPNALCYGDNLDVMRERIASESIDLIYLDPPFNSSRSYNVLFRNESGAESEAQIIAFEDTWHWNQKTEETYLSLVTKTPDHISKMVAALRNFIGTNQFLEAWYDLLVLLIARSACFGGRSFPEVLSNCCSS